MGRDELILGALGFSAQLVDGALGMAFGTISNAALLAMGMTPAKASMIVHTAEVFTTAGSAASHIFHRNVDWRLVLRLGAPGVVGAALGAWILSNIDSRVGRPFIAAYLLVMGVLIVVKAHRSYQARQRPTRWTPILGFGGGFLDASGGGGWGPVVASTLLGSGHAPRQTVGSVNATEFFVTSAAATTFLIELGAAPLKELFPLVIGGLIAAPLGGWMVKRVNARALMTLVGIVVIVLALFQFARIVRLV